MFKRMFNVGGAKVDTVLGTPYVTPGDFVTGQVNITGGKDNQEFRRIYLSFQTRYKHEDTFHEHTLASQDISGPVVVHGGQQYSLPFQLPLPPDTPLTLGHGSRVHLKTGLDIAKAVDPSDSDELRVEPNALQTAVLETIGRLGFSLHQVENEYDPRRGRPRPFVQELEFKPHGGPFAGRFSELEVVFKPAADGYDVYLEMDRRARGLAGFLEAAADMNERYEVVHVTPYEAGSGQLDAMIGDRIARHAR
jgi:sporulation-control protein